ncbi:hypothetical protein CEUSTIGMA_g6961.t1 [Chlamydomonas eustigma]|uniref:Uncharacterized protein n=1 Tax=Chlamydomonas eustigma TaxID=1157962 RepID=A0A250X9S8_9CHLO|nr:hypothetical protein CEUSTIGMA_g6961.t1 [Chlamydomonas eustigma]|eukprot:GAX79520.1 hypothetical protein CEUSTIGMA_g6961.t1 [Chlamydomonas eustigma]
MSTKQESWLNEMGVTPSDLDGLTYGDASVASAMIDERKEAYEKSKNNRGGRPSSGRQLVAKADELQEWRFQKETNSRCLVQQGSKGSSASTTTNKDKPASDAQLQFIMKLSC